jgi:hypothetical protein
VSVDPEPNATSDVLDGELVREAASLLLQRELRSAGAGDGNSSISHGSDLLWLRVSWCAANLPRPRGFLHQEGEGREDEPATTAAEVRQLVGLSIPSI